MCERTMANVAGQVASKFTRSYPWIDRGELIQECWVAMLPALEHYQPELGTLDTYLFRCALRACRLMVWRLGTAANVPARATSNQQLGSHLSARAGVEALECMETPAQDPETALAEAQRRHALAQLVAQYLVEGRDSEAVAAVLLQGEAVREVAPKHGLTPRQLTVRLRDVRERMRADLAGAVL